VCWGVSIRGCVAAHAFRGVDDVCVSCIMSAHVPAIMSVLTGLWLWGGRYVVYSVVLNGHCLE